MPIDFLMPKLGADMTEGRVVEWLKKPGEPIARGEVVLVIETDKANVEVESWAQGTLEKILVASGDAWLPVGTPLAVIAGEGAVPALPPSPAAAPAPAPPPRAKPPERPAAAPPRAGTERVHVSPIARKRAEDLKLDLAAIPGTGPDGRITLEDVERAAAARPAVKPATPADKQQRMREAIAAAMARSKREIPHYYLATEIDLSLALAWLAGENERRPVTERLLPVVLLLKAVARATREVPEVNGTYVDGAFRPSEAVHLGVAISLRRGGLVAPALHDVDRKGLGDLMKELGDLVARTRRGGLRSSELTDGTLTVTNLGDLGVGTVYGVIYPPQVALVGFGRVQERPWAVRGRIEARPVLGATLSGDHRVSDGIRGALFLATLDRLLQAPEAL
jgi:pyruvate dehydrogenase E2 component (dihydrolipoamide acetyltransferase)